MDTYNVVWSSPSRDSSGSMPLGNGDIGLNLWVEEGGDLLLYLSKTDAWSEDTRLLKLGRIRVTLTPNPFRQGLPLRQALPFRQELRLRQGEIEIRAGEGGATVTLRIWVDANQPVVRIEAAGEREFALRATVECWRRAPRELTGRELFSAYGMDGAPHPVVQQPDSIADRPGPRVVWYHRNERSCWLETMNLQGLAPLIGKLRDPLLHLTFGAAMAGPGLVKQSPTALQSAAPRTRQVVSIYPLTLQTETPEEWLEKLEAQVAREETVDLDAARAAHCQWWERFWDRSWIRAAGAGGAQEITTNDLPLRLGADSEGASQFHGLIGRAQVFTRALGPEEIAALARSRDAGLPGDPGLLGDWSLDRQDKGSFANTAGPDLQAKTVGQTETVDDPGPADEARFVRRALRLSGRGWVEVASTGRLKLTRALTLAAWIAPEALPAGGARIIDKSQAGTSNGYLLDTYPGNSLRMIVEANTLRYDARLAPGKWAHVAGTYDAATGEQRLYVNGQVVASATLGSSAEQVSGQYALQRFVSACAGRGACPIKFNGSIFTVDPKDPDETYDADYRRWGGPYWFQNTRLAYWPMLAAGDTEMMRALFGMFLSCLPLAEERTRLYFGHEGAFFPETMTFFGCYANSNFGWDRRGKALSQCDNTYIRWYWSGGLELIALMLDCYAYTRDADFARTTLVPLTEAILTFTDRHYPRREGKLLFKPAQSLETWQDVENPLPEIAGLRYLLPRLLALPADLTTGRQRATWQRLLAELPELPTRKIGDEAVLSPAERILAPKANCENPELYAIYPYRLFGVGKPGLDLARRTFEHREVKSHAGWQQDDTQAAFLGLAREACRMVCERFASRHSGSRFPAFFGPNFDWVPDQDHGCNGLMALQTMLMQCEGDRILLFPAWPKSWDVDFKLHAPGNTTVEGTFKGGKLERLQVTPETRRGDVEVMTPA